VFRRTVPVAVMNFDLVLRRVVSEMENQGIHYAVIGGFAMALRGAQRATLDLDLILMLEDMEKADLLIRNFGYERFFHSSNVSQYQSPNEEWGRIDILHAFRGPTLSMLKRADALPLTGDFKIRVVHTEDIIGLKVQALTNNPSRATRDWSDIRMLLESASEQGSSIDWELLTDYLDLFSLRERLGELKHWYGAAD